MLGLIYQTNWLKPVFFLSVGLSVAIALELPSFSQNARSRLQYNPPVIVEKPNLLFGGMSAGAWCEDCPIAILPGIITPDHRVSAGKLTHYPTTTLERPPLFIYIPDFARRLSFYLFRVDKGTQAEYTPIYQRSFSVVPARGIRRFNWPLDAPSLELNTNYRWYLWLSNREIEEQVEGHIEGAIRRIQPSSFLIQQLNKTKTALEKATIYAQSGIWFEAIKALADSQCTEKSNLEAKAAMADLLKSVQLDAITDQPLVANCSVR